jgi:hypothetical protein
MQVNGAHPLPAPRQSWQKLYDLSLPVDAEDDTRRKRQKTAAEPPQMQQSQSAEADTLTDDLAVLLELDVQCQNECVSGKLRFQRLVSTNLIVVKVRCTRHTHARPCAVTHGGPQAEGLPAHLFTSLFAHDTGAEYPAAGQLEKAGGSYPSHWLFRPYVWAQWLAGLRVLPLTKPAQSLQPSSRMILQRVRRRVPKQ